LFDRCHHLHAFGCLIQKAKPILQRKDQPIAVLPENCRADGLAHVYRVITVLVRVVPMDLMTHDVDPHQGFGTVIPNGPFGYARMRIKDKFNVYVATHRSR
jgi:hypothetical protein